MWCSLLVWVMWAAAWLAPSYDGPGQWRLAHLAFYTFAAWVGCFAVDRAILASRGR
jgi:hypothetical protein